MTFLLLKMWLLFIVVCTIIHLSHDGVIFVSTAITASLHQAMRLIDNVSAYEAHWLVAIAGRISILIIIPNKCCSLTGPDWLSIGCCAS